MAFVTDVRKFQALLDSCSLTQEWQMLMDSVLISDEWMAMAYVRLTELRFRCTGNTGYKFALDLAARTDYKTGTIFACPRSVMQAFANS